MSVFLRFAFTKPKVVSLLIPSVFHPSKTAQEHCTKGNKKAKFVVLNWNKKQPGQTTEQIFEDNFWCNFFMLGIVSLPNDDSWDLFAIQGINGSVGGPAFRLYQHCTKLMNGPKKIS